MDEARWAVLRHDRRRVAIVAVMALAGAVAACSGRMVLSEQAEARRLATALHLEFVRAGEAANRAVFSDNDEASAAAATEAREATTALHAHLEQLEPIVKSLAYDDEMRALDAFKNRFDEYRRLDDEVLSLAVENSNLKAQRLSLRAGQEAADTFFAALMALASGMSGAAATDEPLIARVAVLEIQVLQARHIAEPTDASMTSMEKQMADLAATAQGAIDRLRATGRAKAAPRAAASAALERFLAVNAEIVALSRRNSNVRSTAVTFGRKRVVAAECEDQLRVLEAALAAHSLKATK